MKKKKIIILLIPLFILLLTACGKSDIIKKAEEAINPKLKASDLSIDDFKWEVEEGKLYGDDVYNFNFTNNSKYDILTVTIRYKVKNLVTTDELEVFREFAKEHESYIDEDESLRYVRLVGTSDAMVFPGESIENAPLHVGYRKWHWYNLANEEQYELMEPEELELGIIKDKKVYGAYYDFSSKEWKLDNNTVDIDVWPDSELAKIIKAPKSKHFVIVVDSESTLHFTAYGFSQDDFKEYVEDIKKLGFVDDSASDTRFYGKDSKGYSIELKYSEEENGMGVYFTKPSD